MTLSPTFRDKSFLSLSLVLFYFILILIPFSLLLEPSTTELSFSVTISNSSRRRSSTVSWSTTFLILISFSFFCEYQGLFVGFACHFFTSVSILNRCTRLAGVRWVTFALTTTLLFFNRSETVQLSFNANRYFPSWRAVGYNQLPGRVWVLITLSTTRSCRDVTCS